MAPLSCSHLALRPDLLTFQKKKILTYLTFIMNLTSIIWTAGIPHLDAVGVN